MRDEKRQQMLQRTKQFALAVISLFSSLPKSTAAQVLGRQVLRSGTSVGAHYREACLAKSDADFISKIEGALQELDETLYWLELLSESKIVRDEGAVALAAEANELISIFVTVVRSVKAARTSSSLIAHPSSLRRPRR
jgi:four helix bundle protein